VSIPTMGRGRPRLAMRFEFATATRVVFGAGARRELPAIARAFGTRALVVGGRSPTLSDPVVANLADVGIAVERWSAAGEPTVEQVLAGAELARRERCDLVLAVGGGSAIDAGKAVAALAVNPEDPFEYLEVVGRGRPLARASLPFIAVPTTAGSGAEVTRNAVLTCPDRQVKASLRSALMLPRVAVVDPELTLGLPAAVTAATGLDALAQLIEPYVSLRASPLVDALCLDGIARVAWALPVAFRDGASLEAREEMSFAALLGGMALANAGLGAVHGFAGPIGGMCSAPHGAVCAALLPHVVRANVEALNARDSRNDLLGRFDTIGRVLTGRDGAAAADAIDHLEHLRAELEIPPLRAWGVTALHVPALVAQARRASSMRGNPVELTDAELTGILIGAI
jgi:alcohol dehydrogenase class IV